MGQFFSIPLNLIDNLIDNQILQGIIWMVEEVGRSGFEGSKKHVDTETIKAVATEVQVASGTSLSARLSMCICTSIDTTDAERPLFGIVAHAGSIGA